MNDTPSWYVDLAADEALLDGRIREQTAAKVDGLFPGKAYACPHLTGSAGICDGCLEARLDGFVYARPPAAVTALPMRAVFSSYGVKIACDGDELLIPFVIFAGRDYQSGDLLSDIARKIADDLLGDRYAVAMNHVDVSLYVDEDGQDADFATACSGDDDAAALVAIHVERD